MYISGTEDSGILEMQELKFFQILQSSCVFYQFNMASSVVFVNFYNSDISSLWLNFHAPETQKIKFSVS